MDRKIFLNLEKDYKIVVISDIHTRYDLLDNMIKRLKLSDDDYLIILGDIINRGNNDLDAIDYVKELEQKRERTYVTIGNHEYFITQGLENIEEYESFYKVFNSLYYRTIFTQITKKLGIEITKENFHESFEIIKREYTDYFNYISQLPYMVETDEFIFVHSAYHPNKDVYEDPYFFLKDDNYFENAVKSEKTVVVGHMPSGNFQSEKYTNVPYFDEERNIIFIDGGLGIKSTGELNALVIESKDGLIKYNFVQENDFEKYVVKMSYLFEEKDTTLIRYPNFEIDVLEKGDVYSKCIHKSTNKECLIFNEYINEENETYYCGYEYTDKRFNLFEGEIVELVFTVGDMAFVKYNYEFGWIYLDQIIGD